MTNEIKQLRIRIDAIAKLIKDLKTLYTETATFDKSYPYKKTHLKTYLSSHLDKVMVVVPNHKSFVIQIDQVNSKEIEKSVDSLLLAKAWIGKVIEKIGGVSYMVDISHKNKNEPIDDFIIRAKKQNLGKFIGVPNSTDDDSKNQVINEKGDFIYGIILREEWNSKCIIEKIHWLIKEIKDVIESNNEIYLDRFEQIDNGSKNPLYIRFFNNVYNHLSESIFCLDFELRRIKEEKL